jgi:hypothetical protein
MILKMDCICEYLHKVVEWGQGKLGRFQPLKPHNSLRFSFLIFTILVFLILLEKAYFTNLYFIQVSEVQLITAANFCGSRLIKGCERNYFFLKCFYEPLDKFFFRRWKKFPEIAAEKGDF